MLAHAATTGGPASRAWYVDCGAGSGSADGSSMATAWRTTAAVSAHTFRPGDLIYFRRGTTCTGMLTPHGSGSAGAPIRLDAWGSGPLPRIEARPGDEAALKLVDQQDWTIQHLEFSGGNPHGIFVTGTGGVLHGIHIRDVIVHDVVGEPKNKEGGLLVIAPGTERQRFDDVLVDGVMAFRTSQWAGILVGGVAHGVVADGNRSTNVIVRNSIVHDVAGDGIVLFQVQNGMIENSVAWHTGMQETETIGTPNAIWTWMCRDCTVRRNEAFLTDSPGVDGGAFDIDYGNTNNLVEANYGHDTEGYCIAVFAAGWTTTDSRVRDNICADNGRSPRLAERQGAIFLSTWDKGKLNGVRFSGNRIFWDPPVVAPAVVNIAEFEGTGTFENETLTSASPFFVYTNAALIFDRNNYVYVGQGPTRWQFDGRRYDDFQDYRRATGQDAHSRMDRAHPPSTTLQPVKLTAYIVSRNQVAQIISLHRQYPEMPVKIVANAPSEGPGSVRFDWNTGDIPLTFDSKPILPSVVLTDASGKVVWRYDGSPPPGELGLAIRSFLGNPDYADLGSE